MASSAPVPDAPATARFPPTSQSPPREILALLLLAAAYVVLKRAFGILICDDAYITLSHARSWNAGLGPIMSAGNPVCATSTPLHTVVLALQGLVTGFADYPALAYWTNTTWDLIGLFFTWRIAKGGLGLSGPWPLLAMAAHALSVNALAVSASGMETPMYVALALAGTWYALYSQTASPHLAVIAVLAPLARPEGALLPIALILVRRLRMSGFDRTARRVAWATAAGLCLFFAFNLYAYGFPLPHSIVAKRLEIHVGFGEGIQAWILNVFYKGPSFGGVTAVTLANFLVIGAALAGYARGWKADGTRAPWSLLAWPFLYFLFFMATRSSYALFTWYFLPVLPFLILFLIGGVERLLRDRLQASLHWALFFGFLAWVPAQTFRQRLPQKHVAAEAAREGRYREAARVVDSVAQSLPAGKAPGSQVPLVMIDEVGAVGYWSHARILDTHGLLSPEALPYLGPAEGYWLRMAAMQDKFDPEWILGLRLAKDEGLMYPGEDGLFSGYKVERILRTPGHPYNLELRRRLPPD